MSTQDVSRERADAEPSGPEWAAVLERHAPVQATARRLAGQLAACEASGLAFCRLLERWGRGDARPATAGGREAALRRAAERAEADVAGLEAPLERYLVELGHPHAESRSWYGEPGAAELVDWAAVLERAGVHASAVRVAQVYLELAVLVRALEGLSAAARIDAVPDAAGLWAGLFDLRENLLGRAVDDLRALAA